MKKKVFLAVVLTAVLLLSQSLAPLQAHADVTTDDRHVLITGNSMVFVAPCGVDGAQGLVSLDAWADKKDEKDALDLMAWIAATYAAAEALTEAEQALQADGATTYAQTKAQIRHLAAARILSGIEKVLPRAMGEDREMLVLSAAKAAAGKGSGFEGCWNLLSGQASAWGLAWTENTALAYELAKEKTLSACGLVDCEGYLAAFRGAFEAAEAGKDADAAAYEAFWASFQARAIPVSEQMELQASGETVIVTEAAHLDRIMLSKKSVLLVKDSTIDRVYAGGSSLAALEGVLLNRLYVNDSGQVAVEASSVESSFRENQGQILGLDAVRVTSEQKTPITPAAPVAPKPAPLPTPPVDDDEDKGIIIDPKLCGCTT